MNFVCKSFQYRKKIVWLSDNQCARKKTELPNESIPTTKNLGRRTSGVSIIIPGLIAGYLLTCREEAKDCPQIVVADIDTSPFLQKQTVKIKEVSNILIDMLILNMLNAYNEQFGYVVTWICYIPEVQNTF